MGLGAYLGVMRSALRYTGSYDTQARHLEIIIYHSSISTRDSPIYLSTAGIKQEPKAPKDNCINDSVFWIPLVPLLYKWKGKTTERRSENNSEEKRKRYIIFGSQAIDSCIYLFCASISTPRWVVFPLSCWAL